jgi:hypothetical protein
MRTFAPILFIVIGTVARSIAQENVPLEEAREGARKANATIATEKEMPLQIEADLEKPVAIRGGQVALMIVPDKRMTPAQFGALTTEVSPIAQLWTRNASLQINGEPAQRDRVRVIGVDDRLKKVEVELYLIGARKNEGGASEVLIFGKGKEPLLRLPLTAGAESAAAASATSSGPIELAGRKTGENSGILTLRFAGGRSAEIPLARPAQ